MLTMINLLLATATDVASTNSVAQWIDSLASPWMKQEFIGLEYWKWGALLLTIVIGFVI